MVRDVLLTYRAGSREVSLPLAVPSNARRQLGNLLQIPKLCGVYNQLATEP